MGATTEFVCASHYRQSHLLNQGLVQFSKYPTKVVHVTLLLLVCNFKTLLGGRTRTSDTPATQRAALPTELHPMFLLPLSLCCTDNLIECVHVAYIQGSILTTQLLQHEVSFNLNYFTLKISITQKLFLQTGLSYSSFSCTPGFGYLTIHCKTYRICSFTFSWYIRNHKRIRL